MSGAHLAGWIIGALVCGMTVSSGCASTGVARSEGVIEMPLTRAAAANETVALEVRVGSLPAGARLRVLNDAGEVLGVIAPFGRLQAGGSAHTVPLPPSAVRNGRVRFRLTIEQPDTPPRPPGKAEVESVVLIYLPVSKL